MIYMLALSIGIMYDKREDRLPVEDGEEVRSVPRNVIFQAVPRRLMSVVISISVPPQFLQYFFLRYLQSSILGRYFQQETPHANHL